MHSLEISYFADPKPPKPPNDLKIIAKQYDGRGYLSVKLMWCPSKSNLPVEKYKIFWSRYVNSKEGSIDTDIVYVKDVSGDQAALNLVSLCRFSSAQTNQVELKKLLPNASYYIQVQAMSISGSRRLKSDKKAMLYNTTMEPLDSHAMLLDCSSRHRHHHHNAIVEIGSTPAININEVHSSNNNNNNVAIATAEQLSSASYEARFRLNRKFGMIVQILGLQPHKEK